MSFELLTIVGNVGSAEAKQSKSPRSPGQWFTRISVAVDRKRSDGTFTTVWYRVIVLCTSQEKAESAVGRYRPGRLVAAKGQPFHDIRTRKDTGEQYVEPGMMSDGWPELLDRNNS